jgi:AcrR family transcriptional regulator
MSPPSRDDASTEALRRSLVDHARTLVAREGPDALTMRALAAEAGCSLGLPYKVFSDRKAIVVAICEAELQRLAEAAVDLRSRVGTATVGENLTWFSSLLLDSPAVGLVHEILGDAPTPAMAREHLDGGGVGGFEGAYDAYLVLEQAEGRVRADVDTRAFAFLLAGAAHNLVVAGAAWPRPDHDQLASWLEAVADAIAPPSPT